MANDSPGVPEALLNHPLAQLEPRPSKKCGSDNFAGDDTTNSDLLALLFPELESRTPDSTGRPRTEPHTSIPFCQNIHAARL